MLCVPHSWLLLKLDSTLALSGGVAGSLNQEAEEVGWRIGHHWDAGLGWRIPVGAGAQRCWRTAARRTILEPVVGSAGFDCRNPRHITGDDAGYGRSRR